jgi:hypothetical protein
MSMQITDMAPSRTDNHAPNPRIVNIFKRHSAARAIRPVPVVASGEKTASFELISPNLLDRLANTMDILEHKKA